MIKVITYGTYDLLHEGHINLLKRAKALGDYLIVGVTNDRFDRDRGKLNVRNNVLERVKAIEETGLADQIVIEDYLGQKIDDIQKYDVDIFAIGSDWDGKFDYLNEFCKVVYLPRTEGISSTMLREESQGEIRIGVIGAGRIAKRFVPEAKWVSGVQIAGVYDIDTIKAKEFAELSPHMTVYTSSDDLVSEVDAVYIATPHLTHYDYIKKALLAKKSNIQPVTFLRKGADYNAEIDLTKKHQSATGGGNQLLGWLAILNLFPDPAAPDPQLF